MALQFTLLRTACLLIAGCILCPSLFSASATPPANVPIQADLVKSIDAARAKTGDPILAEVHIAWQSSDCTLRKGAILEGHVVSVSQRTKNSKISQLAVSFESAECGPRQMKRLPLTIAAVMAPAPVSAFDVHGDDTTQPLSEAVGLGLNGGLRSLSAASSTVFNEPRRYKAPKAVMPGQVIGIENVKLSVGDGPAGSSVLSSTKRNIRLETASQLVLVPSVGSPQAAIKPATTTIAKTVNTSPSTSANPVAPPIPTFTDETELCQPPKCNTENIPITIQQAAKTLAEIPISNLGYSPRLHRELESFDYDAAVAYLGPRYLLFTFNPHQLVFRDQPEEHPPSVRIIQADLFDLTEMKLTKRMQWRITNYGQYLWPLAGDKVLIHAGQELRTYGAGLKLEHSISLNGPLDFVRTSPSGSFFAVGIIHERHTQAVHQALLDAQNQEPEEDVEVKVFNANYRILASVMRSSRDPWPVLSDTGEVRLLSVGKEHWRIAEYAWDGPKRVIAQFNSTCTPELNMTSLGQLFVIGCDRLNTGKWYRMLNAEGKAVLKGWASSADLAETAVASPAGDIFAIRAATANGARTQNSPFHGTDLQSERIAVYDSRDGQRLFAVQLPAPVPTNQSFTVSPAGDVLAVLARDTIILYQLPGTHVQSDLGK